jgi:ubiquinone/menaquinone biosynthesis C-methylase UbiE
MRSRALATLNRALFAAGALPYDWLSHRAPWVAHILDVGCGPGVSALEMLRAGSDRVVGLDLSAAMIARARRHRARGLEGARLELLRGDALALPFADGTFDAVTGHSVLYLLPDRVRGLAEMHRVSRPGGTLVLLEPAAGDGARRILEIARGPHPSFAVTVALWRLVSRAAGQLTAEELTAALEHAGFTQVRPEPAFGGLAHRVVATRPRHG